MNDYYVNYAGILVPFYDCSGDGGIDNAIRLGFDLFPPEEKIIFAYPFIRPSDIVYDIGAFTGSHSILFALAGGQVYSFEPSSFNYPRCIKNCVPFKQIRVFDVGFHEKQYDVTTKFKDCRNNLPDNNDAVQFIKYKILPKFIKDNNLPIPDFIKIDIEGMETVVFKTLGPIFENNKTIVYVERHKKSRDNRNLQHYPDNPNWLFTDEGGYDFNDLKKYDVDIYNFGKDLIMKKMGANSDLNDLDEALVIIPKTRAGIVKDSGLKVIDS